MSQRRSYPGSNDFNLDDLFRPEPGQQAAPQQPAASQQPAAPQPAMPQQPPMHPPVQQPPVQQHQQPVPGQGGPEYWGPTPQAVQQPFAPAQAEHAPETQYLPPYPTNDPSAGLPPQQQPYGAPQAPYGAQPSFGGQQQFPAPPAQQQPPYGYQQPAPTGYPTDPAYDGGSGGGRPNQKLIIGGVVAGCAAAGILIAVLMSGGDDKGAGKTPVAKSASSPAGTSGSGTAVSPEMQAQAKSMSDLLGRASASRQSVINAVASVQKCAALPDSQNQLTQAAAQRDQLVNDLGGLKVDKLPNGQQLADTLKTAWQASSTADKEYAAWAGDAAGGCDPNKVGEDPHKQNGDAASGQATTAKTQASDLWNAIAGQTSLPSKGKTEL